jgi:hypothetical protein
VSPEKSSLSIGEVFAAYLGLQYGTTLKQFCLNSLHQVNTIDIRRFISFGLVNGFIRRVHRYAYLPPTEKHILPRQLRK